MSNPLSASDVLNREFLEVRARLLQVAAALDRLDRAAGSVERRSEVQEHSPRAAGFGRRRAWTGETSADDFFSPLQLPVARELRNSAEALAPCERDWLAPRRLPLSFCDRSRGCLAMYYIDPHIHMVSRVTDDYERWPRWAASP